MWYIIMSPAYDFPIIAQVDRVFAPDIILSGPYADYGSAEDDYQQIAGAEVAA
jgi:hypothetical protein